MIRRNLIQTGYPSARVDEVMATVHEMPESLVKAYYDMVREDIKERLRNDPDYQEKSGSDGKSPYEYLDKLWTWMIEYDLMIS